MLRLSIAALLVTACVGNAMTRAEELTLDRLDAARFAGLVEGFDKTVSAATSVEAECFTGAALTHPLARATFEAPQPVVWQTAAVPADANARVTFAVACTLGGEGGSIVGVPFEIAINDKPAVTIHSAASATSLWQRGEVSALFVLIRPDKWGDSAGILLLSVPSSMVEAGKPATISVVGRGTPQLHGSFFAVAPMSNVLESVAAFGGVATLAAFRPAAVPGETEKPGRVTGAPLVKLPGRREDSQCLTGNARGDPVGRSVKIAGRYTYYRGLTDSFYFPVHTPFLPEPVEQNYDESLARPLRVGGWIDFREGKLTDGNLNTAVAYTSYHVTQAGVDVVFDLGEAFQLDEIVLMPVTKHARNVTVYVAAGDDAVTPAYALKPDGKTPAVRWIPIQAFSDRAWYQDHYHPKLEGNPLLPLGGAMARYVRVNAAWKAHFPGWKEIELWGRPASGSVAVVAPLAQAGGEVKFTKPAEVITQTPEHAIVPMPREAIWEAGRFALSRQTVIVTPAGASSRLLRTAQLLSEDMTDERNLPVRLLAEQGSAESAIVLHPIVEGDPAVAGVGVQGYTITVTPQRVDIHSRDEMGAFHATQTLMLLIETQPDGAQGIPACTIRDWPDKMLRPFIAGLPVTPGFIKALARFKVTHYMLGNQEWINTAIRHSPEAADRFLQFVPSVSVLYEGMSGVKPQWVEKAPEEKFEDLNPGRRNICPSNPEVWEHQKTQIDRAAQAYGGYIFLNMDECYARESGARWNVCERCRSRNLSGHEVMAEYWVRLIDYCKSKGRKVWSIDSPFFIAGLSHPQDTGNDWRKTTAILAQRGYADDLMIMNWHTKETVERFAAEGFKQTKWIFGALKPAEADDHHYVGYLLSMGDVSFRPSQLLVLTQGSWTPAIAQPASEACDLLVERWMPAFNELWTGRAQPSRRRDAVFKPIDLRPHANRTLIDEAPYDGKGFADLGPNYDLRALKPGRRTFGGVPFDVTDSAVMVHNRFYFNRNLPDRVRIDVNARAGAICFLHTLDDRVAQNYDNKSELAGYYHIYYADHTFDSFELKYAINIANFDGLDTYWDYAPRGKTMARASMAWRGQMGCGNVATLYQTEWINPWPDKEIRAVIFAAARAPTEANPILIAATLVEPSAADLQITPPTESGRPGDRLFEDNTPVGTKIDLTAGKLISVGQWQADNGITIRMDRETKTRKSLISTQSPHASMENLLYENDWGIGEPSNYGSGFTIAFPQARKLAGLRLNGMYRTTTGQSIDRSSPSSNFAVITTDGERITQSVRRHMQIPDQEGPVWLKLDPQKPVKEIRIEMSCRLEGLTTDAGSLELLEIYE